MLHAHEMDHIVLVVADVERSLQWYLDVVGMTPVRVDEWRAGRVPFPSARVNDGTIIDIIPGRGAGTVEKVDDFSTVDNVDHFCLVVEPDDLELIVSSDAFDVIEGPVTRYGARGDGTSVYVRDPDGNTVEFRHYQSPRSSSRP